MLPISDIIIALLGAGSLGGLVGIANFIGKIRQGKMESEDRLIDRLNQDNKRQNERADAAERRADALMKQRNLAWTQATRFHAKLENAGIEPGEELISFDGNV